MAKIWLLRHEGQGVPLPAVFFSDHPEVIASDAELVAALALGEEQTKQLGARQRLRALSGGVHEVLSGVVVLAGGEEAARQPERLSVARTAVSFNALGPEAIELYVRSGEWEDRAGGYAIQGLGSLLVAGIEGDFSNVVGLPVPTLLELAPEILG